MTIKIIRVFFIMACMIMGGLWARYIYDAIHSLAGPEQTPGLWIICGAGIGAAIALLIQLMLHFITQEAFEKLSPALVPIVLAMVMGYLLGQYILWWWPESDATLRVFLVVTLVLLFGFAGIFLGLTRASNWEALIRAMRKQPAVEYGSPKVVDTSVLIDGRIAEVAKSGFVEGTLIVPRFVLKELQSIADSADVIRRAKGRRGFDILKELQNDAKVSVVIVEDDPTEARDVDGKLILLAHSRHAKVITNDFNLNKLAQVEGIRVLNVNELANALRPAVLPDEQMEVKVVKEGKEAFQGVGYLEDGTMVVVDGARQHVGKSVALVVTSVLQTSAGRMIFGRLSHVVT